MSRASKLFFCAACGILLSNQSLSCELSSEKTYVSLSGPVTHLLEELSLLEDPSLKAISAFHPIGKANVKKVAGGIFMSPKFLKKHKSAVLFYDESRELSRALEQNEMEGAVEIATRGLDPFKANDEALEALRPYMKNCSGKIKELKESLKQAEIKVKNLNPGKKAYVFYLGKILKNQRPPELLIVNDGFVKYLKENARMKTYPGELAYVPWSKRELKKLSPYVRLGIHESENDELAVEKLDEGVYNLGAKGVLTPGLKQARFLERLAESDFFEKAR